MDNGKNVPADDGELPGDSEDKGQDGDDEVETIFTAICFVLLYFSRETKAAAATAEGKGSRRRATTRREAKEDSRIRRLRRTPRATRCCARREEVSFWWKWLQWYHDAVDMVVL